MHKQWAAGAPVIGAAPVPSGRPKRPRPEGLSGSGALRIFLFPWNRLQPVDPRKGLNNDRRIVNEDRQTMAAKNTLKYQRNRLPPILVIVDELIQTCLRAIANPNFKPV